MSQIQPSALSPQPSALSPQPSALSLQRFCRHLISVVLLFVLLLSNAIASPASCVVGWWPKFSGETPAIACEQARNWAAPQLLYRVMLVAASDLPVGQTFENNFGCAFAKSQSDIDDWYAYVISGAETRPPGLPDVSGIGYGACTCPHGRRDTFYSNTSGTEAGCRDNALQLSLTPAPNQKDPRPLKAEGKDGKSTLELIAKVTENGNPKAGVAVTFAVEVEPNSGGHDHHDASRPEGELLQDEDVTDVNGEIKLRFEAPEFAGTHVVAAFCSKCANTSVTKNINVKVPNLIELEGDYSRTAKYELIGSTPKHQGNHFFAPEALIALRKLLPIFAKYDWGVVGINDSSLKWGGRFDIAGRWNGSHHEHLEGKEVDLSFYKPFGTISEKNRQKVYDDLFESKGVGTPQVLWHLKDNPATPSYAHFHVYLLGQSFFRKKPY